MIVTRQFALLLAAAALLAGCDQSGPQDDLAAKRGSPADRVAPGAGRASDASVIRRWAYTLRAGEVAGAARLFAVPATVANGDGPLRLTTHAAIEAFNASLPCGARLVRTRRKDRYTVATFRLTERPGGDCGAGVGDIAATAFRLRAGKIVEWLRVPTSSDPGGPPPPGSSTS
jgi:hypothetical protein